jgi:hypothetical protein
VIILLALALFAQQTPSIDSTYATPALRELVERAAQRNAAPPGSLASYSARVESEVLLTMADAEKRETVLQIEQFASDLFWRRDGGLTQEMIGYRAQMAGPNISTLTYLRVPFVVPTLFADRLDFIRFRAPPRNKAGEFRKVRTLHPLEAMRDRVYRFSGGDSTTIQMPGRTLPIVRVHVEPVHEPARPTMVFAGDIDIDAVRHQVVRMEGRLLLSPSPRPLRILDPFFTGALYVRLENGEYEEQYWLPREQRFEIQSSMQAGERRAVLRGVSRFVALMPNDSLAQARVANPDSFPYGRLLRGDASEISRYDEWQNPLGNISEGLSAYDFEAYAPSVIRPGHGSYVGFSVRDISNVIRINPIEGVFTGAGVIYHLDGNNTLRAHAGYAWSEETARGGAEFSHRVGRWDLRARADRVLAFSDDFTSALNRNPGVVPVLASGNHRFIDRNVASLGVRVPALKSLVLRLDGGFSSDRNVQRHYGTAQLGDTIFLNRASAGDYWFLRTELQHNAAAGSMSLQPGLGWRVRYEAARGDFRWQRIDGSVAARRHLGSWTLSSSIDGGTTLGVEAPPQAQFTLNDPDALPGYDNGNFIGRRAVTAGARVRYTLPLLRSPIRLGRIVLPAIAPAPTVGLHFGWAEVDQRDSLVFGPRWDGIARTSIGIGMRFFGGSLMVGIARPLGRHGPWQPVYSGGF